MDSSAEHPRDRTCAFEDTRLHYVDAGAGQPAVVLVHGWAGGAAVWRHNVPDLARYTRVLAVDLPGHGGSGAPDAELTADLVARSIAAVMEDAGVQRAVLVGHSNGGPVVRRFQRMFPERTAGLVFVDAPLKAFFSESQAREMAAPLLGPDAEAAALGMVDGVVASVPAEHRDEIRAIAAGVPPRVLHDTLVAGNTADMFPDDPIPVPVLALYAKAPFWDDAYEAHVRRLCPDLEYRVWEGAGHFLMLDHPDRFGAAVRDFLIAVGGDD